jgi:hypothetical protein
MKKIIIFAVILSATALLACNGIDSPESDSSIIPAKISAPAAVVQPANSNTIANNVPSNQPMVNNVQPMPAPVSANVTSGLNPAHGQPGHRCDISVGAPLNAPPANTSAKPAIQKVATPIQNNNTNIAAGMNPAHGQPGHRCDIAVGAPLNSPSGKTNAKPALPTLNAPVAVSPMQEIGKPTTGKINPAHGQPGHDCNVQVGAALKN